MNSTTGEAQDHKNPSFELNITLGSQDGSEDICLTEGKRSLDSFKDVRNIINVSLEGCITFLVQLDASRT